ncbi:hypothetical protein C8Q76DRAFT_761452 [Earliella scabrosa]|nr:hypothetical protein C8Q76DRAFT_761452 [Earliella scabrosa]
MSARAPFVPRPPSRVDPNAADKPASPVAYEAFRPNGLLNPDAHTLNTEQRLPSPNTIDQPGAQTSPASFKPLNVAALGKARNGPHSPLNARPPRSRSSVDAAPRAPKPFSSAQHKHLAAPRPSSPFFPSSGMISMNNFRAPPAPAQAQQLTEPGDLSSNKAHIGTSFDDPGLADCQDMQGKPSDSFRFLEAPLAPAHRSRTASHPSLASIHEVEEEDEGTSPRKVQQMGPPMTDPQGTFSGEYPDDFRDHEHEDGHYTQGLRRTMKRVERAVEEDGEYEYGIGAKRYKMSNHQDEYAMPFSGRATPARYSAGSEFARATPPAQPVPVIHQDSQKVNGDTDSKQALYKLLGQDLDIYVEAHADAYEQARKKWAECSVEEWTRGADELSERFAKMVDFVKDHMTAKLSLYASLHTTISEHRTVLAGREKTLNEAKDSLLREGGAVVGVSKGGDETKA